MTADEMRFGILRWTLKAVMSLTLLLVQVEAGRAQPEWRAPVQTCLYTVAAADSAGPMLCIRKESFNRDLCRAIDYFAHTNNLPPDYFARLIWRESTFRPDAISPKGARGIAQFMPETAKLRGLRDSDNVLEALRESAEYLDELRGRFGNLGLAAAAYNAGENGLSGYIDSGRLLPSETRSYVIAITGHGVEEWKDDPPAAAAPALDKDKSFLDGCVTLASRRRLKQPPWQTEGVWTPWGVQIAAHFQPALARRLFTLAVSDLPPPLNKEQPLILRVRDRSFGFRPRYAARIGRQTRAEADQLCATIHQHGGACSVFKN
jgi:hypothetical protein